MRGLRSGCCRSIATPRPRLVGAPRRRRGAHCRSAARPLCNREFRRSAMRGNAAPHSRSRPGAPASRRAQGTGLHWPDEQRHQARDRLHRRRQHGQRAGRRLAAGRPRAGHGAGDRARRPPARQGGAAVRRAGAGGGGCPTGRCAARGLGRQAAGVFAAAARPCAAARRQGLAPERDGRHPHRQPDCSHRQRARRARHAQHPGADRPGHHRLVRHARGERQPIAARSRRCWRRAASCCGCRASATSMP